MDQRHITPDMMILLLLPYLLITYKEKIASFRNMSLLLVESTKVYSLGIYSPSPHTFLSFHSRDFITLFSRPQRTYPWKTLLSSLALVWICILRPLSL